MNGKKIKILLIENDPGDARSIREMLSDVRGSAFDLEQSDRLSTGLKCLEEGGIDVVLLGLELKHPDCIDTFDRVQAKASGVPILVLADFEDEAYGHKAVRKVTQDYLVKGRLDSHLLERSIRYAIERRQAVEALKASEEYSKNIIESSLDMIIAVDKERRITKFNKAAEETFGYLSEEVLGKSVNILYEDSEVGRKIHKTTLQKGRSVQEILNKRKNGKVFPSLLSASVLRNARGEVVGVMGISRDITERKQAVEALKASEVYSKNIIESSLDMIIAVDNERRITEFNKAAEETFGYLSEEVLGKSVNILYGDSDVGRKLHKTTLHKGRSVQEILNKRKNGEMFPSLLSSSVLRNARGEVVGVMGISRDITKRKLAEEEILKAKQAAEEANTAKSRFLANMSHELRTPLNSVIGFANILLRKKGKTLTEKDRSFLERIVENGKHLLTLINDMLDLSKVESGRTELEIVPVSLDVLVRETVGQIEPQIREGNVRLVTDVPEGMIPLETDEEKLKQVLINLIGNALKFTEEGSVTVCVEVEKENNRPVSLAVVDTGIGIPEDQLAMIFEAFQQVDTSTARKYGGTGLGLTISRSLCELMRYEISVESQVGKGSRFTVLFDSTNKSRNESDEESKR